MIWIAVALLILVGLIFTARVAYLNNVIRGEKNRGKMMEDRIAELELELDEFEI